MRALVLLVSLIGCTASQETPLPTEVDDSLGLLGDGRLNPFPSTHAMRDGHVDLPIDELPVLRTRLPVERLAFREGFSPGQPILLDLPDLAGDTLPSWRDPTPGQGAVLLLDLTDDVFLPVMAELDANPDATQPTLIIRPQIAIPYGHLAAVAVTTEVVARPQRFDDLVSGSPPSDFAPFADHYQRLLDSFASHGVDTDSLALAWDFPIGDGTTPLSSAIDQLELPGDYSVRFTKERDDGDSVSRDVWRYIEGSFSVPSFLQADERRLLDLNDDGSVNQNGTETVTWYASIPESLADAPAGSAPVMLYGHGIFSNPSFDLDPGMYPSGVNRVADMRGAIVLSVAWRGLDYNDSYMATAVANDFGQFPTLSDRMVQGQVDMRALLALIRDTDFMDDPVFSNRDGQPLADTSSVAFYGISMGGIEGAVFLGQQPGIKAAALHVPGAGWSTMLERASQWSLFDPMVAAQIPDAATRQRIYAISQLWWDPVDPVAYAAPLSEQMILVQESIGDDMVHNMATTLLARSLDLPALTPNVYTPNGMQEMAADLPKGSRAFVQFDSLRGEPPDQNRPSPESGAHTATMMWTGSLQQTVDFLEPGKEGRVNHYCGDSACTRVNSGSSN